jgi:hypothetical protein
VSKASNRRKQVREANVRYRARRRDGRSHMPMSEAIAALVFDLDGVLVDSESVWDAARREIVARNGGRWQADATRAMMGMSSPEWSRYLHDQLGVPLKPEQINARHRTPCYWVLPTTPRGTSRSPRTSGLDSPARTDRDSRALRGHRVACG